jgi:3-hydroxyisobutyrate dehydrogenase
MSAFFYRIDNNQRKREKHMAGSIIKTGFIGTGVMGGNMALNLLKGGYEVGVYNRTKKKASDLIESGALWFNSVPETAKWADAVITIVGYPSDVEQVYFGGNGLIANMRKGGYLIDMTTSKPSLAARIYDKAKERGVNALDAPVSGGDVGAKNATLTIMAGGDKEAFEAVRPVLEKMGKSVFLMGGAGSGQYTKLCNQIAVAANIMGVCESLACAEKAGLDPAAVISCISGGAAGSWQLTGNGPKMIAGDYSPGFYIKHFVKDIAIALEEAEALGVSAHVLKLAKSLYGQLVNAGDDCLGTQALYKLYTERILIMRG